MPDLVAWVDVPPVLGPISQNCSPHTFCLVARTNPQTQGLKTCKSRFRANGSRAKGRSGWGRQRSPLPLPAEKWRPQWWPCWPGLQRWTAGQWTQPRPPRRPRGRGTSPPAGATGWPAARRGVPRPGRPPARWPAGARRPGQGDAPRRVQCLGGRTAGAWRRGPFKRLPTITDVCLTPQQSGHVGASATQGVPYWLGVSLRVTKKACFNVVNDPQI